MSQGLEPRPTILDLHHLKTAVLRCIEALQRQGEPLPVADLAASFESTVATVLSRRSVDCALDQGLSRLVVVGGVAANRRLRHALEQRCREEGLTLALAPLAFCGDNAAILVSPPVSDWPRAATAPGRLASAHDCHSTRPVVSTAHTLPSEVLTFSSTLCPARHESAGCHGG